jgi:TonB family protein
MAFATFVLVAAGCQHAPAPSGGTSSFKVIEPPPDRTPPPPSGAKIQMTGLEQYREASVQEKTIVLPVYPPRALKAKAGAAQVGVRVRVDMEGRVSDVRPSLLAASIIPPGFRADFEQAVEAAVRQWKFHPAKVQHVEVVTEKGFTYSRVTRTELLDAEFDLSFTFTPAGRVESGKQVAE